MLSQAPVDEACGPDHVAIIMDGNGRWARARGMPRTFGHRAGVEAVRRTVRTAPHHGIRYLTLYAFSSENWSRPPEEVRDLLGLLRLYIHRDLEELAGNGVRVRIIGSRQGLQPDIGELIDMAEERTKANVRLNLNIAFNYGGRDEILRAAQSLVDRARAEPGTDRRLTTADLAAAMDTGGLPDPDLIIRTSGEMRLSNFLLWQAAYSELVFLDCLWPDFAESHLVEALETYRGRDRRYGAVAPARDAAI
ncbi:MULTISPECIES: isoprenyl transferase [unclassified Roseitalea]|uniref:isoprenyl transferase n=1 Tax=unclassified Roseitalea TaxID=2639107 RepID=UPI00274011A8|nr:MULTISPECIES: isoprenyl transferase [unclassified Roseitalea]